MIIDKLIKRKGIFEFVAIGDTKIKEMIEKGYLIKPVQIPGFNEELFSLNELQEWIKVQKAKRNEGQQ